MIDRRFLVSAAFVLLTGAAPALAQDAPLTSTAPEDIRANLGKDTVTIGGLAAYLPDYEGSNDYRFEPAPVVIGSVSGFNFSVLGNRASIDLIPDRNSNGIDFQAGPIAKINLNRSNINAIDDVRVKALGKRSASLAVGGYVGIGKTGVITSPYDKILVSVSYRQGVTGSNRSYTWEPSVTYATPLSTKAGVALFGSAEYSGEGYANTYFSISPSESIASGLPAYNAHKGWRQYTVGGIVTYSLTGNLLHGIKVIAGGSYSRLLNDFGYSPIVRIAGSKSQWLGTAGLAYTF